MSGFPSGGEALGSASFGLRADGLSEFARDMTAAGNHVDTFGERASVATSKGFFGGLKGKLAEFDAGLMRFIGPLARIGGLVSAVAVTFYKIGNSISEGILPHVREWNRLMEQIEAVNKKGKEQLLDLAGRGPVVDKDTSAKRVERVEMYRDEIAKIEKAGQASNPNYAEILALYRGRMNTETQYLKNAASTTRTLVNASGGNATAVDFSHQARSQLVGALRAAVHGGGR